MKKIIRRVFKQALQYRIARKIARQEIVPLFIVGHMRSGSSLLVHLLANNTEILGYGETHYIYRVPADLNESIYNIVRSFGGYRLDARFYLDKVLHTEKQLIRIFDEIRDSGKFIFLIREPKRSLPSILSLRLQKTCDEQMALAYYVDRLNQIGLMAQSCSPVNACFLTYDELVSESTSSNTLAALTDLLGLDEPLTREYGAMWSTGRRGMGDASGNIHAGHIVSTPTKYPIQISAETLRLAEMAYRECVEACGHLSLEVQGKGLT